MKKENTSKVWLNAVYGTMTDISVDKFFRLGIWGGLAEMPVAIMRYILNTILGNLSSVVKRGGLHLPLDMAATQLNGIVQLMSVKKLISLGVDPKEHRYLVFTNDLAFADRFRYALVKKSPAKEIGVIGLVVYHADQAQRFTFSAATITGLQADNDGDAFAILGIPEELHKELRIQGGAETGLLEAYYSPYFDISRYEEEMAANRDELGELKPAFIARYFEPAMAFCTRFAKVGHIEYPNLRCAYRSGEWYQAILKNAHFRKYISTLVGMMTWAGDFVAPESLTMGKPYGSKASVEGPVMAMKHEKDLMIVVMILAGLSEKFQDEEWVEWHRQLRRDFTKLAEYRSEELNLLSFYRIVFERMSEVGREKGRKMLKKMSAGRKNFDVKFVKAHAISILRKQPSYADTNARIMAFVKNALNLVSVEREIEKLAAHVLLSDPCISIYLATEGGIDAYFSDFATSKGSHWTYLLSTCTTVRDIGNLVFFNGDDFSIFGHQTGQEKVTFDNLPEEKRLQFVALLAEHIANLNGIELLRAAGFITDELKGKILLRVYEKHHVLGRDGGLGSSNAGGYNPDADPEMNAALYS